MLEKKTNFSPGLYVAPGARPKAYLTKNTHSSIRHDYATWHPNHLDAIESKQSKKIPYANKSKFDSSKIIDDAIEKSNLYHAFVAENGYFVVIFDIGYQAGYCSKSMQSTSCVTVITKQTGEVVTAYPGKSIATKT